jgi:hypothetical protein
MRIVGRLHASNPAKPSSKLKPRTGHANKRPSGRGENRALLQASTAASVSLTLPTYRGRAPPSQRSPSPGPRPVVGGRR